MRQVADDPEEQERRRVLAALKATYGPARVGGMPAVSPKGTAPAPRLGSLVAKTAAMSHEVGDLPWRRAALERLRKMPRTGGAL